MSASSSGGPSWRRWNYSPITEVYEVEWEGEYEEAWYDKETKRLRIVKWSVTYAERLTIENKSQCMQVQIAEAGAAQIECLLGTEL